jgi:transposase-like protein
MQVQVSLILNISARTSVTEIEQQIQQAGRISMRQAMKESIRAWEKQQRRCPRCGSEELRVEGTVSRHLQLLFGPVRLALRRYRCQHCLYRWCPARLLLTGLHQQRISPGLRQAAVLAGASWPYRQAAHLLQELSGAQISAEQIRLVSMQQGRKQAEQQQQQAQEEVEQAEITEPQAAGIISMDGGWVGSREQHGGMEGKVGVIARDKQAYATKPIPDPAKLTWYEISKRIRAGKRIKPAPARYCWKRRLYVATFAGSSQLGTQVHHTSQQLGIDPATAVVVADGANWIKKQQERYFPQATCILDWPHLWRVVRKAIGEVQRLQGKSASWRSYQNEQMKQWLWQGQVQAAQARLQRWRSQQQEEGRALHDAITYLHEQRAWIGSYEQWKAQGLPVGSGIIERAVAIVINRRMKKRGMRWRRDNATALVALRVAFLNDDWQREPLQRAFP